MLLFIIKSARNAILFKYFHQKIEDLARTRTHTPPHNIGLYTHTYFYSKRILQVATGIKE